MNQYDIVFMGYMGTANIVPFEGSPFFEQGGPAFFGPIAASCLTKRVAVVTKIAKSEGPLLEPLKAAGIDLYVQPGEAVQYHIVHPTKNIDERQLVLIRGGGSFCMNDLPPIEPCLIHLGGVSGQEFPLEFMRAVKARGFHLSVDMQSFVFQMDKRTRGIRLGDVPEKQEILRMNDFVKLDVMEARALTGTDILEDQASMLEGWGSRETVITRSDGVLARSNGKTAFAKFTNRSIRGRTGRGDTFFGAYLARRLDHSVEDSLRFAAALTSIKMESLGPFKGSLKDVLERMDGRFSHGIR